MWTFLHFMHRILLAALDLWVGSLSVAYRSENTDTADGAVFYWDCG